MQNAVECVYALDFPPARMARALARRSLKCSSQLKPDTNAVAEVRSDPLAHFSAGLSAALQGRTSCRHAAWVGKPGVSLAWLGFALRVSPPRTLMAFDCFDK